MASIFDLYSQKSKSGPHQHGPYEFSKKRAPKASPSDPFLSAESPQRQSAGMGAKLPLRLGLYQLVTRGVSGGGSIQVIRRKPLEPTVPDSLPSLPLASTNLDDTEAIPASRHKAMPHSYMENRRYWDSLEQQLAHKPPAHSRELRKSKTMTSVQFNRSMTTLSVKVPMHGLGSRLVQAGYGTRPVQAGHSSQEEESWKRDIRERAAALVYAKKGVPKVKKYMGQ